MATLKAPELGLSLANITADAVSIDWSDMHEGDGFELVLPHPTYGDWSEHAAPAPDHVERIAKRSPNRPLSDDDESAFAATDSYYDWRDGFAPMMNYAWPVSLAYGVSLQSAAALVNQFGPSCSLVTLSDETLDALGMNGTDAPDAFIALSGGGMNLSDHIAAAYLACGCVPPTRVLEGLPGVISERRARAIGPALRRAYRDAAAYHRARISGLSRARAGVYAKREA